MGLFFLLAHEDAAGIGGVATEKRKQQVQGWEAEAFDFWAATRASASYQIKDSIEVAIANANTNAACKVFCIGHELGK
jgi:hypothetical protein